MRPPRPYPTLAVHRAAKGLGVGDDTLAVNARFFGGPGDGHNEAMEETPAKLAFVDRSGTQLGYYHLAFITANEAIYLWPMDRPGR